MRAYEYRHIVGFEETNLVGNVYYANHVRWQGRVREMFLREHVPELSSELEDGLSFVTTRVSCEYHGELKVFDEVIVRMYASAVMQNRITMRFDYLRVSGTEAELIAKGEQQVACIKRRGGRALPVPLPAALVTALSSYMDQVES